MLKNFFIFAIFAFIVTCYGETLKFTDDFSLYDKNTFPKNSEWNESGYGKHPSAVLNQENGNSFLQGAGGGDRRVYRIFPPGKMRKLMRKKYIVFEFKRRGWGGFVQLGKVSKYRNGQVFSIFFRSTVQMTLDKKSISDWQNSTGKIGIRSGFCSSVIKIAFL